MDRAQISVGKNGSAVCDLNAKNVHVEPQNSDFIPIELYMLISNVILIIHLDNNQKTCRIHGREWLGCLWTFFLEQGLPIGWLTNWLNESKFFSQKTPELFYILSWYYTRDCSNIRTNFLGLCKPTPQTHTIFIFLFPPPHTHTHIITHDNLYCKPNFGLVLKEIAAIYCLFSDFVYKPHI